MGKLFGSVLVVAIALCSAGCERTPRDRLQGRWLGEGVENVSGPAQDKANGWVKGTAIEFSGSKVTVTIPAETPRSGTYRVAKAEGDAVTLTFARDEGGRDEARFRFVGETGLRWDIGSGREVLLVRERKN